MVTIPVGFMERRVFCDEAISLFMGGEKRDCFVVALLAMTGLTCDSKTNEQPRSKLRGINPRTPICYVASHGESNPKRLKNSTAYFA